MEFTSFTDRQRKKAMRNAIIGQSIGIIGNQALFRGGLAILITFQLGGDPIWAILAFNAFNFSRFASLVTTTFIHPSSPKKLLLNTWFIAGCMLLGCGLVTSILKDTTPTQFFVFCLYVFSAAIGGGVPYWFPLLQDVVPLNYRGRFFSKLRACWTLTSLVVILILAQIVSERATTERYGFILEILGLLVISRNLFIRKIPELRSSIWEPNGKLAILQLWIEFKKSKKFHSFLIYWASLTFLMGIIIPMVTIFMKQVLQLNDSQNIIITILGSAGALLAFSICGYFVDKIGSRSVFTFSQITLGLCTIGLSILSKDLPFINYFLIGASMLITGMIAASGVAATTQLFHMIAGPSRYLFTAIFIAIRGVMGMLSTGLTGILLDRFSNSIITIESITLNIHQAIFLLVGFLLLITTLLVKKINDRED